MFGGGGAAVDDGPAGSGLLVSGAIVVGASEGAAASVTGSGVDEGDTVLGCTSFGVAAGAGNKPWND